MLNRFNEIVFHFLEIAIGFNEMLFCFIEIVFRFIEIAISFNEIVFRLIEIAIRFNEIVIHFIQIVFRFIEIPIRFNEIVIHFIELVFFIEIKNVQCMTPTGLFTYWHCWHFVIRTINLKWPEIHCPYADKMTK